MSSVPPGFSPMRLPLGEVVFYPASRPSIRALARQIAALGYSVAVYPFPHTDLSALPPGVWHWSVVIRDCILFIVPPSELSELSSDQSNDELLPVDPIDFYSLDSASIVDSDQINPDFPWLG